MKNDDKSYFIDDTYKMKCLENGSNFFTCLENNLREEAIKKYGPIKIKNNQIIVYDEDKYFLLSSDEEASCKNVIYYGANEKSIESGLDKVSNGIESFNKLKCLQKLKLPRRKKKPKRSSLNANGNEPAELAKFRFSEVSTDEEKAMSDSLKKAKKEQVIVSRNTCCSFVTAKENDGEKSGYGSYDGEESGDGLYDDEKSGDGSYDGDKSGDGSYAGEKRDGGSYDGEKSGEGSYDDEKSGDGSYDGGIKSSPSAEFFDKEDFSLNTASVKQDMIEFENDESKEDKKSAKSVSDVFNRETELVKMIDKVLEIGDIISSVKPKIDFENATPEELHFRGLKRNNNKALTSLKATEDL